MATQSYLLNSVYLRGWQPSISKSSTFAVPKGAKLSVEVEDTPFGFGVEEGAAGRGSSAGCGCGSWFNHAGEAIYEALICIQNQELERVSAILGARFYEIAARNENCKWVTSKYPTKRNINGSTSRTLQCCSCYKEISEAAAAATTAQTTLDSKAVLNSVKLSIPETSLHYVPSDFMKRLVLADLDPATAKLAIGFLGPFLSAFGFLFILRIVMSWYPKLPVGKFPYVIAYAPTEPLLIATRKLIPPLAGVDVTPVVWQLCGSIPDVVIPLMYKDYTTHKVLVMEWVEGKKLSEVKDLYLIEVIQYRGSFNQLLECGFYHADPHPGNLLRTYDGKLAYLDFGMTGEFKQELRDGFIQACLHLVNRDFDALSKDFVTLGCLPKCCCPRSSQYQLWRPFRKLRNHHVSCPLLCINSNLEYLHTSLLSFEALGSLPLFQDGVFRVDRLESLLTESLRAKTEKSLVKQQPEGTDSRMAMKEILSFTLTEKGEYVREIIVQEFAK
ncbi:hypothetical protein S245_064603, partial [Arachis hypogaea]